MASAKELVAIIASEMGIPKETVVVMDRLLAEAGLRTRALRGRGQTPMTYLDAANLIIATAWDANPRDVVRIVSDYGVLPAERVKEHASIARDALGVTFGTALANMLEIVPKERAVFSTPYDAPDHHAVKIIMHGPMPRAEIIVTRGDDATTFEYGQRLSSSGDLMRTVQFSQITLGFVGEVIASGFGE